MITILLSMESYDKGLLESRWFENTSWNSDRESLVQNWENPGNQDFFVGGQNLKLFEILFFIIFLTSWVLCQNWNKNESKLSIL